MNTVMAGILAASLGAQPVVPGAAAAPRPPSSAAARARRAEITRDVYALIGLGAGFGLGVVVGFRAFDDAAYAEKKIGTTVFCFTLAGGVSGYLVGWKVSEHRMRDDAESALACGRREARFALDLKSRAPELAAAMPSARRDGESFDGTR